MTRTIEETFGEQASGDPGGMRSPTVPARAIAYMCTCSDPTSSDGQIVRGPRLHDDLGF